MNLRARIMKAIDELAMPWNDEPDDHTAFYDRDEIKPILDALMECAVTAKECSDDDWFECLYRIDDALAKLQALLKEGEE